MIMRYWVPTSCNLSGYKNYITQVTRIVLNSISKEKSDFSGFMMFILENHIVRLDKFSLH